MKYLMAAAFIGGNALLIWGSLYFGGRWTDRMFSVQPPVDPDKPIVLPVRGAS